ncbi:aspartate aminotransferase family protein [Niveispirillum sp. KHB5.9]|uniref:aspartate aminotransferase family protein n=1 Tax=Niveispirillum sp. KHB5.9 TaxID=3400269 RepID=UPI003A845207
MKSPAELRASEAEFTSQGDTAGKRNNKIVVSKSNGVFLKTDDGRELLDMQMFNSSANFGYGSPTHHDAVVNQLEDLPGIGSEYQSAARIELAAEIALSVQDRFGKKGRVHFSVSGAQAVEDALKVVAVATGSRSVFAFEGSYHGRTLAAASVSSSYRYRHKFGGDHRASFVPFPYCYRCPYGKSLSECGYYCVSQFERLFESEFAGIRDPSGALEYTAFLAEPVLGRGGYIAPPPEYFPRLKEVLSKYGVLLICDDIQMGIYRTGKLWSLENFKVEPDILLFGKALTNGLFPVSGLWAREPLLDPSVWTPSSAHATFAGHPVGMAAGLATFSIMRSTDFEQMAERVGGLIEDGLRRIANNEPSIGRVDRLGLAISVEFCHPASRRPWGERASAVKEAALQADSCPDTLSTPLGLLLTVGGYHDNIITLSPAVTMTEHEVHLFLDLFEKYLKAVQ